jgi:peptidyl-prolyl cis-trans isomerase SurA
MRSLHAIRSGPAGALALAVLAACAPALPLAAQAPTLPSATGAASEPASNSASPVVLDRAVAVVNRHVILSSDIDDEIRLSVLDPNGAGQTLTRAHALEQLISRALIEQQIRQEDVEAATPPQSEVDARLAEIRNELPPCVRENCSTDAGWNAFLAAHDLTAARVESYLRYRLEILGFIEQRFRQGIRISPQEIAAYYTGTLVPQYAPGETVPSLDQVAPRIEEILLQQQVNALFDDWLANLRKEGDVEILDPSLESGAPAGGEGGASQ